MGHIKNIKLHIVTDIKLHPHTEHTMSLHRCSFLLKPPQLFTTTTLRTITTTTTLNKIKKREPTPYTRERPRVLPVVHQVVGPHSSQYFTPYPQLTKEQMEEPPPPVSNRVRKVLELSRGRFEGTRYIPPEIHAKKFREIRKQMIIMGHEFPDEPQRDRFLEPMEVVEDYVVKKEERLKNIAENMKKMPKWIEEYKEERLAEKEAIIAAKQKAKDREWKIFQEKKQKVLASDVEKPSKKKGLSQAIKAKSAAM